MAMAADFVAGARRRPRVVEKRQEIQAPCEELSCGDCVDRPFCSWCDSGSAIGSAFGSSSSSGSCESGNSCSSPVTKALTDPMQCPSTSDCMVCDGELDHISPCDDSTGRTVQYFCSDPNNCPETIPCTICAYTDASSFPDSCQWEKYAEAVLREPAFALVVGLLAPVLCIFFWLCRCCGLCGGCRRSKGFFRARPRRDVKNPEDAYAKKEVLANRVAVYAVAFALLISFIVAATGNAAVTTSTDQIMLDVINQADSLLSDLERMTDRLAVLNDRAFALADGRPGSPNTKRSIELLQAGSRLSDLMAAVESRARYPISHLLGKEAPPLPTQRLKRQTSGSGSGEAFGSPGNDFNEVIDDALELGNGAVDEVRAVRVEVTEGNGMREDAMLAYFAVTFGLVFFAVAGACCKAPCCAKCFAVIGPWVFFLATIMYVLHYVVVLGLDDGCVFLSAALNGEGVAADANIGVGTGNPADFLTDCDAFTSLDSMRDAVDDAITELYSIACDGVVQVCDFRAPCTQDPNEECDYANCPDFAPSCNETTLLAYLNITVYDLEIGCVDAADVMGGGGGSMRRLPEEGRNPVCPPKGTTNLTEYGTPADAQDECERRGFDAAVPCEATPVPIASCPDECQNSYLADATWLVVEGTRLVDDYRLFWVEELRPLLSCNRLTRIITQVLDFVCVDLRDNVNAVTQGLKWCIVFYCFGMIFAVLGSKRFTDRWDNPDDRPMRRMARRLPRGEEALLAAESAGDKLGGTYDFDEEEEGEVTASSVAMVELGADDLSKDAPDAATDDEDDEDDEARAAKLRSSVTLSAIDDGAATDDESGGGTYEAPPKAGVRSSVALSQLDADEPPPPFAPDSDAESTGTVDVPDPPAPADEETGTADDELRKDAARASARVSAMESTKEEGSAKEESKDDDESL